MTILLLFSTIGILPSIQTFYSVLLKFRKSRSHKAPCNAESGLATSNNEVSSDEQSTKCSGAALIKKPPCASHTTAATCDSTLQVFLQDKEELSFHQDHEHDRHQQHLSTFGSISPTVQTLDFSVRVISHTGPQARSSERRLEQRLFGQLSEIAVVVQNLIDFLQVLILPLHGHKEFRTTTVTDCIRQTSVVSLWQPQCSTSSSIDASGTSSSIRDS